MKAKLLLSTALLFVTGFVFSQNPYITFTTTKSIGSTVSLVINASEESDRNDVWIDLNGNDIKDSNESVTTFGTEVAYIVGSQYITVHGKVHTLDCKSNNINVLNTANNPFLEVLYCYTNQITELDLSKNSSLKVLNCKNNNLKTLDLSSNTMLTKLYCSANYSIASLMLNTPNIEELYCDANQVAALTVSGYANLKTLVIARNQIKGSEMTDLVNSLFDRRGLAVGKLYIINTSVLDGNMVNAQHIQEANIKNWTVYDMNGGKIVTPSDFPTTATRVIGENAFSVYPNPTSEYIKVTLKNENLLDKSLLILDITGKVLKEEKIVNKEQLVKLSSLNSGIYFIYLNKQIVKFVKE